MSKFNSVILETAGSYLGTEEWPGAKHNPVVVGFFQASGNSGIKDDETPWCAAFVGAVLAQLGLPNTGRLNARSYLDWGSTVKHSDVIPGDVVILARGAPPSGHVGFVVRVTGDKVTIRGGNQGNKVSDANFPISTVLGFRRADGARSYDNRPTLREGSTGLFVADLQTKLQSLGFQVGNPDGVYGRITAQAVLAFQNENDLKTDAEVGPLTWKALDTAQPRPTRDVTLSTLRERESTTVMEADKVDLTAGVVGVVAVGQQLAAAGKDAQGILGTFEQLLRDHWVALLVIAVGYIIVRLSSRKIKLQRLEDAITGKNLGK